jgi:F-type H+-transporting ATPase subunit a
MADPVLHIKDGYYFEVPKFLWRHGYTELSQVPEFLRAAHPEETVAAFNRELDGKILIPQPFATLKNLHEKDSGFAISKFMVLEFVAAVIICWLFIGLANQIRGGRVAHGRLWNMLEAMVLFLRNDVVRAGIGEDHGHDDHGHGQTGHATGDAHASGHGHSGHAHHHASAAATVGHSADRFLPLFWTMFFFILTCNLLGMIPWAGAPTGSFGVTFGLACAIFATSIIAGILKFGPVGFWLNQVPSMDLPLPLAILLKPMIFAIELLGLCIKHAILAVRLLANMVAGHLVLLGIMGLITAAAGYSTGLWATVTTISVVGSTLFSLLELLVAFLQAYIFTFLAALFIGAATHKH